MARRTPPRLLRLPLDLGRRLVDLLGPTGDAARQSLAALAFNSSTSFIAGATLGSLTDTFERYPGLLLMVPAAIGLRGNIFGGLGNRLSTSIHAGTFGFSTRRDTVLGQNLLGTLALTLTMSFVLALVAKVVAVAFDLGNTLGVFELVTVSMVGGLIASLPLLLATLGLSFGAVRRGWDMDNLVAPTTATLGDAITIPSLYAATLLLRFPGVVTAIGTIGLVLALVGLALPLRSHLEDLRQMVRESAPVLAVALALSTLAGLAVEKRLAVFTSLPALLVLLPAFVSSAGALGGILASRMATGLHLGTVEPSARPGREVRADIVLVLLLGLPVYIFNALGAHSVGALLGEAGPGWVMMLAVALIGGLITVLFVIALAYYGTITAWRMNIDPDNVGIPVVTASVDFVGAVALITTVLAIGLV